MIPPLDPTTGHLPTGRYAANLEQVATRFVHAPKLARSESRPQLWEDWERHRACVEALLGEMPRIWLAGSFISSKLDPDDIDVFYGFDPAAYDSLTSEDLVDLEDLLTRETCVKQYGMRIDAYGTRLPDPLPVDSLRPMQLSSVNLRAFQDLGLYDEIWHRVRHKSGNDSSSTVKEQSPLRRGYLEVQS